MRIHRLLSGARGSHRTRRGARILGSSRRSRSTDGNSAGPSSTVETSKGSPYTYLPRRFHPVRSGDRRRDRSGGGTARGQPRPDRGGSAEGVASSAYATEVGGDALLHRVRPPLLAVRRAQGTLGHGEAATAARAIPNRLREEGLLALRQDPGAHPVGTGAGSDLRLWPKKKTRSWPCHPYMRMSRRGLTLQVFLRRYAPRAWPRIELFERRPRLGRIDAQRPMPKAWPPLPCPSRATAYLVYAPAARPPRRPGGGAWSGRPSGPP